MRNLVFAINISLDGCCDHTKFGPDKETMDYFTQLTRTADTFFYGRKTYELMVPFWPDMAKNHSGDKADNEFAEAFDSVKKIIVCSHSLEKTEEKKTTIIRTNLRDEVLKLKQEPGKNILTGGVVIPSQLMELGLIDEYHFVVHPVIVGQGARLLEGISLPQKLDLKLIESKTIGAGCMALRYRKQ